MLSVDEEVTSDMHRRPKVSEKKRMVSFCFIIFVPLMKSEYPGLYFFL